MKTIIKILSVAAAVATLAFNASALSIGDQYYLGSVDEDTPAALDAEAAFINYLRQMTVGDSDSGVNKTGVQNAAGTTFSGQPNNTWDFVRSDTDFGSLPGVNGDDSVKPANNPTTVDVSGWTYLLAKYGNVGHIWVVSSLSGDQTLPDTAPGGGRSHSSVHGPRTEVPDGGATAALLGLGLLGLVGSRRRI